MSRRIGPCMCGATDCPSCGPAQGYEVVRIWRRGRYIHVNPEDLEDGELEAADEGDDFSEPDEYGADRAADLYERDLDRTASQ